MTTILIHLSAYLSRYVHLPVYILHIIFYKNINYFCIYKKIGWSFAVNIRHLCESQISYSTLTKYNSKKAFQLVGYICEKIYKPKHAIPII